LKRRERERGVLKAVGAARREGGTDGLSVAKKTLSM
jgi:hypothetical protein